jgi:hypothetical protein
VRAKIPQPGQLEFVLQPRAMKPPEKNPNWGGPGRGQGRKALDPTSPTVIVPIRMTQAQKDKMHRLGGPQWVRERIDKARE